MSYNFEYITEIYSKYKREDNLCQTNGYFSLNVRKSCIQTVFNLLNLNTENDNIPRTIGWIGFGDGRELFCIAKHYPDFKFTGFEINEHAYNIACRVLSMLNLKNITLKLCNAIESFETFGYIYSTAISGQVLYDHLYHMCLYKLCILKNMWSTNYGEIMESNFVCLSGSGERRQIISCIVK